MFGSASFCVAAELTSLASSVLGEMRKGEADIVYDESDYQSVLFFVSG